MSKRAICSFDGHGPDLRGRHIKLVEDNDLGEYCLQVYDDGARHSEVDYFTVDLGDAVSTAICMCRGGLDTKLQWRFYNGKNPIDGLFAKAPQTKHHDLSTYRIARHPTKRIVLYWNGIPMCEQPDVLGAVRYAELHFIGEWNNADAVREAGL